MVLKKNQAGNEAAVAKKEPAKKPAKKEKAAAKSRVTGVKNFLSGVKTELKKVHWPTRRETMVYTGVVLATVTVVAAIIWVLDSILSRGLGLIIG